MSTFKKVKVVMLPTNQKAPLSLFGKKLVTRNEEFVQDFYQHLYFLSDEPIEIGDYVYCERKGLAPIVRQKVNPSEVNSDPMMKKVIATTDKSIIFPERFPSFTYLPEPSKGFIQKFADAFNSGNPIEYAMVLTETHGEVGGEMIKVNQRDNTITTRKTKDTWNREEVVSIINKTFFLEDRLQLEKWIEENLPS